MLQELHDNLSDHYSDHYRRCKNDSHPDSRASLLKRFRLHFVADSPTTVLDIGSGPQSLFRQFRGFNIPTTSVLISLDIADIKLLRRNKVAEHVRANGISLPFADAQFDSIISNLALDFLGKGVYEEIKRVLRPKGNLIINLQHPQLEQIYQFHRARVDTLTEKELSIFAMWEFLLSRDMIFSSEDEIVRTLEQEGFQINRLCRANEKTHSESPSSVHVGNWWEVDAVVI